MATQQEIDAGLEYFKLLLPKTRDLRLLSAIRLPDRAAQIITIGTGPKKVSIVFTHKFLSELIARADYQQAATSYIFGVAHRMIHRNPMDFYCMSGIPIQVEIEWPTNIVPTHATSYVRVPVYNLRERDGVAICDIFITHQQTVFDLKENPFILHTAIVNTVRGAVDSRRLHFHTRADHPIETQMLELEINSTTVITEDEIERFLAGKVYWTGFKQGGKATPVWIGDDIDAAYLRTEVRSLIQASQILEAEKKLVLHPNDYASTGVHLLLERKTIESRIEQSEQSNQNVPSSAPSDPEWDVFICHASEDKDTFVRALAEELQRRGTKVWYDEFTLRLGDSLRREIDRGLSNSRYGIVILSPSFLSKGWAQKELDGLVAREVHGKAVILPIWHNLSYPDVVKYSPTLADKVAASSFEGIPVIARKIVDAIRDP